MLSRRACVREHSKPVLINRGVTSCRCRSTRLLSGLVKCSAAFYMRYPVLPRAATQALTVSPQVSTESTTLTEAEIRSLAARFGSPLLVVDCEQVRHQYHALQAALPGVDLHYALKPLPHVAVVACLRDE